MSTPLAAIPRAPRVAPVILDTLRMVWIVKVSLTLHIFRDGTGWTRCKWCWLNSYSCLAMQKIKKFLVPLNCLETSFSAPLGKKKHKFDFLYHICRLIVHCFFPPRDKIMIPIIGQQAVWKPILERSSYGDALKFVEYGNFLGILRWGFRTNSAIINIYKLWYIVFLLVWFEQEKRSSRPASNHVLYLFII